MDGRGVGGLGGVTSGCRKVKEGGGLKGEGGGREGVPVGWSGVGRQEGVGINTRAFPGVSQCLPRRRQG